MKENSKPNLEEWIKIDAILQKKLKELETLDNQRKEIIKKAEKNGEITAEIKAEMNKSIESYELLSFEIKQLKQKAKEIKQNK